MVKTRRRRRARLCSRFILTLKSQGGLKIAAVTRGGQPSLSVVVPCWSIRSSYPSTQASLWKTHHVLLLEKQGCVWARAVAQQADLVDCGAEGRRTNADKGGTLGKCFVDDKSGGAVVE